MTDRRVKLTPEQVTAIVSMYEAGGHTQFELAVLFKISPARINYLIKKHLG